MPSFEELLVSPHVVKTTTSLAYWVGNLDTSAPLSQLDAGHLRDLMSFQYEIEDQYFWHEYPEIDPIVGPLFKPVAPVTLTRRWCPMDSAEKWLGDPLWLSLEGESALTRAVAAVWEKVDTERIHESVPSSEDEAHFRFLLLLTAERAYEAGHNILLVCCPGWSFESAVEQPMGLFGYSALSAGRLYPERVPSGSIKMVK